MACSIGSRGYMGIFAKDFAEITFIGISAQFCHFLKRMAAIPEQGLSHPNTGRSQKIGKGLTGLCVEKPAEIDR